MEPKEVIIDLNEKTDLLAGEAECPCCGHRYYYGIQSVEHHCNKCDTKYKTDFKQDIYTKKARYILSQIGRNDIVKFRVSEKFADVLDHIDADFRRMKCWDIDAITTSKEHFKYCKDCGVCLNCWKCLVCNEQFELGPKSKHRCPSCKSTNIDRPIVKVKSNNKGKHVCESCNSDKVRMSTTKKDTCDKCKGKNLSPEKFHIIYWLIINRKGGYRL